MPSQPNNRRQGIGDGASDAAPSIEPASEIRIFRSTALMPFAVLPNEFLQASGELLSPEAIGVGAHLLSRPPNWNVSIKMLQAHHRVGREKVRRILCELADAGFAGRFAERDQNGQWRGQYWVLSSVPYHFGERPPNHYLVYPSDRPKTRLSVEPSVGPFDGRQSNHNKKENNYKAQIKNKPQRSFPERGTITWSYWGEIAREELGRHGSAMPDVDLVAANFRKWCVSANIALDAQRIERTFRGFCRKVGPA